jgi:D-galactose 1-dehydrogenase
MGGADLRIDGRTAQTPSIAEYPSVYEKFAALIHAGQSDVDVAPLQLVADAFLCGRRIEVAPFVD